MIHLILEHIRSELNDYMKTRAGFDQDRVIAACFFTPEGQPNPQVTDKVVVEVVNVAEDRIYHSVQTVTKRSDATGEVMKPEVRVNLYVLFACNFPQYSEALKAISQVIAFFQHRAAFDCAAIPTLQGRRGRVTVELFSPTFEQQNHLWGALGAKYVPSVLYKVGLIGISDQIVEGEVAHVTEILTNEHLQ